MVLDLEEATVSGTGSGGSSYTIPSPSSATVTIRYNNANTTPRIDSLCPTCKPDLFPMPASASGGNPAALAVSGSGIAYGSGLVSNQDPGLTSPGFGETFGPSLGWSNLAGLANNATYGIGWVQLQPALAPADLRRQFMVVTSGNAALWFDLGSSSPDRYVAEFDEGSYTFQADGNDGRLTCSPIPRATSSASTVTAPACRRRSSGQFESSTDPYGNTIAVTAHNTGGQITQIERNDTGAAGTPPRRSITPTSPAASTASSRTSR